MTTQQPSFDSLLVLPHVRVQNANCISSPLTWGFPSVTAFAGLMTALELRFTADEGVRFKRFGVVCHHFEPQVTKGKYTSAFNLTRNPVDKDGATLAIVEEGRAHLKVSLLFALELDDDRYYDNDTKQTLALRVMRELEGMRVAGGSVIADVTPRTERHQPCLVSTATDDWDKRWRKLRMQLLPGYALVLREDLLQMRFADLKRVDPLASLLDAWLDLTSLTMRAAPLAEANDSVEKSAKVEWRADKREGWTVPIPVGYAAISEQHAPGTVANARDPRVPFQFVESIYSIGQWISPHRVSTAQDLLWSAEPPTDAGIYRCTNSYAPAQAVSATSNPVN